MVVYTSGTQPYPEKASVSASFCFNQAGTHLLSFCFGVKSISQNQLQISAVTDLF